MQTQLLHLHLILHLHLPPDYLPFQLNMGCIFCLSCTIWAGRALLDSVTYIICIICLLTVATYWRTCLPAALAQMPRYLIIHSCPNIYRIINCQNRISAQYQTPWPHSGTMLDTTQTTLPMIETLHFPITSVHLATSILIERLRHQTLNSVTNAYLCLQLVVIQKLIQKCLRLCCKN